MLVKLFDEHETELKPIWWVNFLKNNDLILLPPYQLNIALKPYGAQFLLENDTPPYGTRYINFDTVDNYVFFMLKWM